MDPSSTFNGTGLLAELHTTDGMSPSKGKEWISKKTGRAFDSGAMYRLSWPEESDPRTWSECPHVQLHVMSDLELVSLEIEVRRQKRLPPRRPWEAHMFASAMGRSER
jgi:hypothetical protein